MIKKIRTFMCKVLAVAPAALGLIGCDGGNVGPLEGSFPEQVAFKTEANEPMAVKAFYLGHSLLKHAGDPNIDLPYNIGVFARTRGHDYSAHGQLGWGTGLEDHWGWKGGSLEEGPNGFSTSNHEPFFTGRSAQEELATGQYNLLVMVQETSRPEWAKPKDSIQAIINFTRLARQANPATKVVVYSGWTDFAENPTMGDMIEWRDDMANKVAWCH